MRQIIKRPEPPHFTIWKNNFRALHGRDATYDDLKNTTEYFMLKKSLVEEQGYICCYCEKQIGQRTNLTDCDIEHFMPRHPDTSSLSVTECALCINAQLDYDNLFASCKGEIADSADHCNHKKGNWFDFKYCISPSDPRINGLFGFKLDGRMIVINPIAQEMDKHINLNSYVLKEQRKISFETVLEEEFEDEDLLEDMEYVEAVAEDYNNLQDGKYAEFCSMIKYCLERYLLKR